MPAAIGIAVPAPRQRHAAAIVATSTTACTPNATGSTPSHSAPYAALLNRSPGAAAYHATPRAASTSTVQTTTARSKGNTVSGVTSHTSGGGFKNGDQ